MSDVPAGFWRRYAAWTLDATLVGLPVLLLAWPTMRTATTALAMAFDALATATSTLLLDGLQSGQAPAALAGQWLASPALHQAADALQSALGALLLPPLLGFVALALVYGVAFERSAWRATPGKRALDLVVVDDRGRRLTTGHALLRFCAGALSWLTLNLGHALAALPPRHRALHDLVSGTQVLRRDDTAMPPWARGWVALQLLALLVANAWLLRTAMQAMQAGFDRLS